MSTALASARVRRPVVVASAGIGMIGVTFGMARYGVGLLAPEIRADFSLSSASLGLLASASYVAYLVTSVTAGVLTARLGARAMVAAGGLCAVIGMTVAGMASSTGVLFAGLLVAGASAGLVFPPFSDVVATHVAPDRRPRVLAAISSGTGWGVAIAAPVALAAGSDWQLAWLLFAALAAAATLWALTVLPAAPRGSSADPGVELRWRWFVCPRSRPLLFGALGIGLASSAYWTFAVDHLAGEGGLSTTQSRVFLGVVGVASVGGSVAGDAVRRLGAGATFVLSLGAEALALALMGLAPSHLAVALVSAVLFGVGYNVVVTVEVIWSGRLFDQRPSAGLAAIMVMQALGLLVGPPVLGALADHVGSGAMFAAAAALALATMALWPRERLDSM